MRVCGFPLSEVERTRCGLHDKLRTCVMGYNVEQCPIKLTRSNTRHWESKSLCHISAWLPQLSHVMSSMSCNVLFCYDLSRHVMVCSVMSRMWYVRLHVTFFVVCAVNGSSVSGHFKACVSCTAGAQSPDAQPSRLLSCSELYKCTEKQQQTKHHRAGIPISHPARACPHWAGSDQVRESVGPSSPTTLLAALLKLLLRLFLKMLEPKSGLRWSCVPCCVKSDLAPSSDLA